MPEVRYKRYECVTMGHEGCQQKTEKQPNGWWKPVQVIHLVYGRKIIEKL